MASPSGGGNREFVLGILLETVSHMHSFTVGCSIQLEFFTHSKSCRIDVESVGIFYCEQSERSILVV